MSGLHNRPFGNREKGGTEKKAAQALAAAQKAGLSPEGNGKRIKTNIEMEE